MSAIASTGSTRWIACSADGSWLAGKLTGENSRMPMPTKELTC
jgi:hypothetical protein